MHTLNPSEVTLVLKVSLFEMTRDSKVAKDTDC